MKMKKNGKNQRKQCYFIQNKNNKIYKKCRKGKKELTKTIERNRTTKQIEQLKLMK
jgi:hypothetical protein